MGKAASTGNVLSAVSLYNNGQPFVTFPYTVLLYRNSMARGRTGSQLISLSVNLVGGNRLWGHR